MKEIKFRAFRKSDSKMYIVGAINFHKFEIFCLLNTKSRPDYDGIYGFLVNKEIELMQYTELKDKNGKEIYENDIVMIYSPDGEECYTKVIEDLPYAYLLSGVAPGSIGSCKVIGNIYENPELIHG